MKVILLAPLPPPSGGIAGWTQRMQCAKLNNGWSVAVVDEKLVGKRNEKGAGHKKSLLTELSRSFHIWKELKNALNDSEAKIVQACIPATPGAMLREIVSAKITHIKGRKFITHFRCTVPNMVKTRNTLFLLKCLIKNSDCFFCLNQQTIDYIKSLSKNADCRFIPNFVDISETYRRVDYSEDVRKIVYTGRIFENKGCKQIVDVARNCPDIHFELIGKVMMELNDIPTNVILSGEKDREYIRQELKDADLFMFLTRFPGEGFSNSLTEAMAYSLPCIVTDWAANRDMIGVDGGIVLDNPSNEDVISAIHRLRLKDCRRIMGENNYKKVIDCYSQERVLAEYVDSYEDILK